MAKLGLNPVGRPRTSESYWARIKRKQQARYKANRQCSDCRKPKPQGDDHVLCPACRDDRRISVALSYERKRARGECQSCSSPCLPDRRKCGKCLVADRIESSLERERRRALGICYYCGASDTLPKAREEQAIDLCQRCYLKAKSRQRLRTNAHWMDLLSLLEKQDYRCAYSGRVIVLGVNDSLDHILPASKFPELARSIDNVQWVTRDVNHMKKALLHDDFLGVIEDVFRHSISSNYKIERAV